MRVQILHAHKGRAAMPAVAAAAELVGRKMRKTARDQ